MSVHRSLKSKAALKRRRNVLTRGERIEALKKAEKWQEGRSVFGLPLVRVERVKRKKELAAEAAAGQQAAAPTEQPKDEDADE